MVIVFKSRLASNFKQGVLRHDIDLSTTTKLHVFPNPEHMHSINLSATNLHCGMRVSGYMHHPVMPSFMDMGSVRTCAVNQTALRLKRVNEGKHPANVLGGLYGISSI